MGRGAISTFGVPLISRTMVVADDPGGFSPTQAAGALRFIGRTDANGTKMLAVPITNAPGLLAAKQLGTTLVAYLYPHPSLSDLKLKRPPRASPRA